MSDTRSKAWSKRRRKQERAARICEMKRMRMDVPGRADDPSGSLSSMTPGRADDTPGWLSLLFDALLSQ